MTTNNIYEGITHTVYLTTVIHKGCEHCNYIPKAFNDYDIGNHINHYIDLHGYRLLHVGQEWSEDTKGASTHHTVAVLGK